MNTYIYYTNVQALQFSLMSSFERTWDRLIKLYISMELITLSRIDFFPQLRRIPQTWAHKI